MNTVIALSDGVLVEVEAREGYVEQTSDGLPKQVGQSLDAVRSLSRRVLESTLGDLAGLGGHGKVKSVELSFGLSFGVEGSIYIAKANTASNLSIKINIQPNSIEG